MDSATKRRIDESTIRKITKAAFGDMAIEEIRELVDGYFNVSYLVVFEGGRKEVLKIAPDPEVTVQRYEHNLMASEVIVMKLLEGVDAVKVPKVSYYDSTCENIDSQYFFMEYLPGVPLNRLRNQLSDEEYNHITVQLAQQIKQIHMIESDYFGFISNTEQRFSKWGDCFCRMITDLFDDARDVSLELPLDREEAEGLLTEFSWALDEVVKPVMVHKDLWDGNIFVDENTRSITGIIDCERALYAEPLLEMVCAFQQNNDDFLSAFLGRKELRKGESVRVKLYEFYIYLLIFVEVPYRKYADSALCVWSKEMLGNAVEELRDLL